MIIHDGHAADGDFGDNAVMLPRAEIERLTRERDEAREATRAAQSYYQPQVADLRARIEDLDAEIARLRRLTEQQADELARLRGAETRCAWAAAVVRDAAVALDAAGAPRERDGLALALAERIAATLPPLPEPAGEWERCQALIGGGVGAVPSIDRRTTLGAVADRKRSRAGRV